ncbi:MAG: hypothetical protein Q7S83_01015 [bacterium]|nr:hypothetical protein [bacterium]
MKEEEEARMDFELHITVDPPTEIEKWTKFCKANEIKPVLVELSKGQYPIQMMCAVNLQCGFVKMEDYITKLEEDVRKAGFTIMRTKLECRLGEMATLFPQTIYHETHFIFGLQPDQVKTFMKLSDDLNMAWSRNLLPREDGLLKYYLTQRISDGMSPRIAEMIFAEKLTAAKKVLPVRSVHLESAIFDRGRYIDRGWIE